MAITITKEPDGIYPAYNDSFIEFTSDLADNNKAEIIVYPTLIFSKVFVIYPDPDGVYLFNLKEAVKVIFNENGFKDSNFFTDAYSKSISGLFLSQDIKITVLNDSTSEYIDKTYEFFKAVKQIGEVETINSSKLLSYSKDGINHSMTYFEGFPFNFDILKVTSGSDIIVKSLNTGNETDPMIPTTSDSFRINIDRGNNNNWTFDNILPLTVGLNRLEIYEDAVFKTNLLLTKKKICSGVYMKWFNRNGGFSHFLFNNFFIESVKGKDLGTVLNNELKNIYDITGNFKSIGKDTSRTFIIKTNYNSDEYEILKDIFISPLVQIYTSFEAYKEGRFIDVFIEGNISFSNKKGNNELIIKTELPQMITVKL